MARSFGQHAMIGAGGVMRVPRSESAELDRVMALLKPLLGEHTDEDANETLGEALEILERLRKQVSGGYHRNPAGSVLRGPIEIAGILSHDLRSVAYRHAKDSKLYKHDFERNSAEVLALIRNGKRDLLLSSPDGIPLWDEF